jgi:hypothetical protein
MKQQMEALKSEDEVYQRLLGMLRSNEVAWAPSGVPGVWGVGGDMHLKRAGGGQLHLNQEGGGDSLSNAGEIHCAMHAVIF